MLKILHGSKKYIPSMKALWKKTFNDDESFIDLFFDEFYTPRRAFLRFDGEKLVSMLFYLDLKVKLDGRRLKCAYLYAVATELSERRQGHFTALHNALLSHLQEKKYDIIITVPEKDSLFNFYKNIGYNLTLRRLEYELETLDLTLVSDLSKVWELKKALHKKSRQGLSILESEKQFLVTAEEHRYFESKGSYFGFYPQKDGYCLYNVISEVPSSVPVKLVHYSRSALIYDITGRLDPERMEKEKPVFNFLLS